MMTTTIPDTLVITYLEMTRRSAFRPAYLHEGESTLLRMETPDVQFYRFLYSSVGGPWRWRDRALISDEQLEQALRDPGTSVDVMYAGGVPAGYVELVRREESTEIAYFGLRPNFYGRGLGKHLLSWGIAQAWSDGAQRVWVHTCNLDAPHAIENYLKRGFTISKVTEEPMPARYR